MVMKITIATEWNGPRVPYVAALDDQVQSGKDALEQIRVDAEYLSTVRNDGEFSLPKLQQKQREQVLVPKEKKILKAYQAASHFGIQDLSKLTPSQLADFNDRKTPEYIRNLINFISDTDHHHHHHQLSMVSGQRFQFIILRKLLDIAHIHLCSGGSGTLYHNKQKISVDEDQLTFLVEAWKGIQAWLGIENTGSSALFGKGNRDSCYLLPMEEMKEFNPENPFDQACPMAMIHSLIEKMLQRLFGLGLTKNAGPKVKLPLSKEVVEFQDAHYSMSPEDYKVFLDKLATKVSRHNGRTILYTVTVTDHIATQLEFIQQHGRSLEKEKATELLVGRSSQQQVITDDGGVVPESMNQSIIYKKKQKHMSKKEKMLEKMIKTNREVISNACESCPTNQ